MYLSVTLPAYDEVENLERVVSDALLVTSEWADRGREILIVDDGSRDGTGALADALSRTDSAIRVVHHPSNQGFSGAMITCFREASGDWIFLAAADGQIPIAAVRDFLTAAADDADIVVGVRDRRRDAAYRRFLSHGFHFIARILLGIPQREFSSAFLFRRSLIAGMKLRSRPRSATVLPEILYRARLQRARVREVVVEHRPRIAGRAKGAGISVIAHSLMELIRLSVLLRLGRSD